MGGPVEIVAIVAAIGYVLFRRVLGEPAQAKRMLVLPAVLSLIGVSDLSGTVTTPMSLVLLVATTAISVALGALRGASVRISRRDGVAFVRYTWVTIALWVVNVVVKVGANLVLGAGDAAGNSLLFTLGLGILAEGLVVLGRATQAGHRVLWTADRTTKDPSHDGDEPVGWNTRRDRVR